MTRNRISTAAAPFLTTADRFALEHAAALLGLSLTVDAHKIHPIGRVACGASSAFAAQDWHGVYVEGLPDGYAWSQDHDQTVSAMVADLCAFAERAAAVAAIFGFVAYTTRDAYLQRSYAEIVAMAEALED